MTEADETRPRARRPLEGRRRGSSLHTHIFSRAAIHRPTRLSPAEDARKRRACWVGVAQHAAAPRFLDDGPASTATTARERRDKRNKISNPAHNHGRDSYPRRPRRGGDDSSAPIASPCWRRETLRAGRVGLRAGRHDAYGKTVV